jgi:tetratricopeptide (TPR) repeat protein
MNQQVEVSQPQAIDPASLRLLVAEGERQLRETLVSILRELGFQNIIEAVNGSDAWTKLRKYGADFVIAGWHMPEMNGMALLKIMRTDPAFFAVPLFLVTPNINKNQVIEAGEAGVTDIILLPLTKDTLGRKLDVVFEAVPEPEFQMAEKYFQEGLEFMNQNRWQEALSCFQQVLTVHQNAEVYYNMGYIKTAQGRYEEAIQYFRRATRIKNDFARAHQKMGECYVALDRPNLAQKSFQTAAEIYMEKQMDDHAEQVLKEVLKINPDTINVYNNLGIIYRRQKRYQKAINQYKKAVKVNPTDENIYYNMGRTYFDMEEFENAKIILEQALEINPNFKEATSMIKTIDRQLEE